MIFAEVDTAQISVWILDVLVLAVVPFIWKLSSRLTRIEAQMTQAEKEHAEVKEVMTDTNKIVRRELRPNGGESIFDRVTNIEASLTEVKAKQPRDDHGRFI